MSFMVIPLPSLLIVKSAKRDSEHSEESIFVFFKDRCHRNRKMNNLFLMIVDFPRPFGAVLCVTQKGYRKIFHPR